ncbi:GNAT family N-acetyltransferase [Spirochaeta dissipatitropha]
MIIVRGYDMYIRSGIDEVFFLTASRKEFDSEADRSAYYYRWAGSYLDYYPQWVYTAREDDKVLGYLLGCPDTRSAIGTLEVSEIPEFLAEYDRFPAHLHINVHPHAQGRGIGRKLMDTYWADLRAESIPGVHLITTESANNAGFYRSVGFNYEVRIPQESDALLFLGKEL